MNSKSDKLRDSRKVRDNQVYGETANREEVELWCTS